MCAERTQSYVRDVDLTGLPIVPREVSFQSGDRTLAGFLFLPPGEGPFAAMVFNHGSGVDKGSNDLSKPSVAATLMSWGIAGFIPHRRGYGNSPGPGWRDEVTAEFGTKEYDIQLVARLDRESDDVVAAPDGAVGMRNRRTVHRADRRTGEVREEIDEVTALADQTAAAELEVVQPVIVGERAGVDADGERERRDAAELLADFL